MMTGKALSVASAVLLSFTTSACTAGATATGVPGARADLPTAGATAAPEGSADIGNGRPVVTYDGPMVRRRVVLQVRGRDADAPAARAALEPAAARLGMDLADLPVTVLDARALEGPVPALTLALPEGRTMADGRALIDACPESARHAASMRLATVLVHDVAFRVPAADPAAVARFLDAEGILSDVLGTYDVAPAGSALSVGYTGPLLSDASIRAVRVGIARAADAEPAAVAVTPRTPTGNGVRLSGIAPEDVRAAEPHGAPVRDRHEKGLAAAASTAGAARTADGAVPGALFLPIAGGVAVAWVALLVLIGRRRAAKGWEVRHQSE